MAAVVVGFVGANYVGALGPSVLEQWAMSVMEREVLLAVLKLQLLVLERWVPSGAVSAVVGGTVSFVGVVSSGGLSVTKQLVLSVLLLKLAVLERWVASGAVSAVRVGGVSRRCVSNGALSPSVFELIGLEPLLFSWSCGVELSVLVVGAMGMLLRFKTVGL